MIHGKTVTLKMIEPQDMQAIMEILKDPDVTRYLMQGIGEITVNNLYQHLYYTAPGTQSMPMGIFRNDTGELIGVTVVTDIHPVNRSAHSKYTLIKPSCWKEGFAADALFHLFSYLFLEKNIRRITGHTIADNLPAEMGLRKGGFRCEGVEKKQGWFDGRWCDRKLWACLKKEFNWDLYSEDAATEDEDEVEDGQDS